MGFSFVCLCLSVFSFEFVFFYSCSSEPDIFGAVRKGIYTNFRFCLRCQLLGLCGQ